jgi:hypothetical protein
MTITIKLQKILHECLFTLYFAPYRPAFYHYGCGFQMARQGCGHYADDIGHPAEIGVDLFCGRRIVDGLGHYTVLKWKTKKAGLLTGMG